MLNIGVRAHDFGRLPAEQLASRIAARGLRCVQLALNKAIAGLELKPGDLTPGLARRVGRAFFDQHVEIAVLGCYINLSHPDAAAKKPLLAYFKDHLCYARDLGCSVVGTETGSLNPDWSPHPYNYSDAAYRELVPVVAELVAAAEHFGVIVGIEGVAHHVLHSPVRIRQLLDDIASPNLQVIFDPVNLLSSENYRRQDEIMQQSFELFGDRIAIIHAKDFAPDSGRLRQLAAGTGSGGARPDAGLNYPLLLGYLQQHKPGIQILLEESSDTLASRSMEYLSGLAGA